MGIVIDMAGAVAPIPNVCTQLTVSLPGGMVVQGVVPQIGASPLAAARASIGAASSALAPLGPFFAVLEAVLSIVKFATTVPKVVMNPGAVVEAVAEVAEKAGALARLVPQLSVPLMILGVVDVLIAFIDGLAAEVEAIAQLEERANTVGGLIDTCASLAPIHESLLAQVQARQATVSCAVGDAQPILGVVSTLAGLIGISALELDLDGGGSLSEMADALTAAADALQTFRSTIPL